MNFKAYVKRILSKLDKYEQHYLDTRHGWRVARAIGDVRRALLYLLDLLEAE